MNASQKSWLSAKKKAEQNESDAGGAAEGEAVRENETDGSKAVEETANEDDEIVAECFHGNPFMFKQNSILLYHAAAMLSRAAEK